MSEGQWRFLELNFRKCIGDALYRGDGEDWHGDYDALTPCQRDIVDDVLKLKTKQEKPSDG